MILNFQKKQQANLIIFDFICVLSQLLKNKIIKKAARYIFSSPVLIIKFYKRQFLFILLILAIFENLNDE
jgi:hypothetical protein